MPRKRIWIGEIYPDLFDVELHDPVRVVEFEPAINRVEDANDVRESIYESRLGEILRGFTTVRGSWEPHSSIKEVMMNSLRSMCRSHNDPEMYQKL